jgi:hypothetical protein
VNKEVALPQRAGEEADAAALTEGLDGSTARVTSRLKFHIALSQGP